MPGSPYISRVTLDDVDLPLDRILAAVSIRTGRDGFDGPAQASTATVRLQSLTKSETGAFEIAATVRVFDTDAAPMFAGRITDVELADDDPRGGAVLTLIATGPLSRLGTRLVGFGGFPAELWGERVARILAEADVAGVAYPPDPDVPLAAFEGKPDGIDALAALTDTCDDVGATMFDTADGLVAVQSFDARAELLVDVVDPATVVWAPTWAKRFDIANRITLTYGYGAGAVTVEDQGSIDRFDVCEPPAIDTGLLDAATAHDRALLLLNRTSYPSWQMPSCELTIARRLAVGARLRIAPLPSSAPVHDWSPIVEGWVDAIEGSTWRQDVALSDPLLSGLALLWQDVPADAVWGAVPPSTRWRDATRQENLSPSSEAFAHAG